MKNDGRNPKIFHRKLSYNLQNYRQLRRPSCDCRCKITKSESKSQPTAKPFVFFPPVIVDVKLQNLKANHNRGRVHIPRRPPVIVDVKLQNLKANHNIEPKVEGAGEPVIVDVKLQNLKANHNVQRCLLHIFDL